VEWAAAPRVSPERPAGAADRAGAEKDSARALDAAAFKRVRDTLEQIRGAAAYLGVELPGEPGENSARPGEAEEALTRTIIEAVEALGREENAGAQEKRKVEEALHEARAFANLNASFADLDQLSYLALRVGRLEPRQQEALRQSLADRAVIVPLDQGGGSRILAAASRKGRFALDSELKKAGFAPIVIPEGYKGVPQELIAGLESHLAAVDRDLAGVGERRKALAAERGGDLAALAQAYLMVQATEQLKARLVSTKNAYLLAGWAPADEVGPLVEGLERIAEGRVAVRAFNPEEIPAVREGREKVPVSLSHGRFVRGFEGLVFSYGAPLYGTLDPTPLVAVFFTVLFGIMFGDLGQGCTLLVLGLLTSGRGVKRLAERLGGDSTPLIAVGISSMVMGLLTGEIFTNENLLVGPTRAITGWLTGHPVDRVLTLMPLAEKGGSVTKLFYFFGFTIGVGVILNSAGLIVNIVNQITLGRYEKALFAKTGVAGTVVFWYALSLGVRLAVGVIGGGGFRFAWFDAAGLAAPALAIFFGPALWRLVSGERPVFPEGALTFVIEGIVEILETVSTLVSNTVSFFRVGAFALSHAVLAYIVFRFSEEVTAIPLGGALSLLIIVAGNAVIILLEGMIVAIQVTRLQYYEFFSKFFTETGVEFAPFRFRKGARS